VASIESVVFDEPSYPQGATMTVTYTPDHPPVVAQAGTDTATLSDAAGNPLASLAADFTVMVPQADGDVISNADSSGRAWGKISDDGSVAVFTATA
jgi:hypothetical protein